MALRILIGNPVAKTVQLIICIIAFLHHTICFIWYLRIAIKSSKSSILQRIVFFPLFMNMLFSIFLAIWVSDVLPKVYCGWIVNCNSILLSLTRLALYYFFLERLILLLNHADLEFAQFKRYQIYISRFLIISWSITINVLLLVTGFDNAHYNDITSHCGTNYPFFVYSSIFIADLFISITISILLGRRLKVIESRSNKSNILKKFMLLSIIAIITTQFSAIMWIVLGVGGIWTSFDSIINIWCILFTLDVNKMSYNRIFGKLHACVGNKCLSCYTCSYCCKIPMIEELKMAEGVPSIDGSSIEGANNENNNSYKITYIDNNITVDLQIHTRSKAIKSNESINTINTSRNIIDCTISKEKQESLFRIYTISPAKCISKCIEMGLKDEFIDQIIAEFEINTHKL